jgi:hypothetical protein
LTLSHPDGLRNPTPDRVALRPRSAETQKGPLRSGLSVKSSIELEQAIGAVHNNKLVPERRHPAISLLNLDPIM